MIEVNEIFNSINGEVNPFGQGILTTFLRLRGCNLKCSYCDTDNDKLLNKYSNLELQEVLIPYLRKTRVLAITGGEPLLQKEELNSFLETLPRFWYDAIKIYIETNGTFDLNPTKQRVYVYYCMDYKLDNQQPSKENLHYLDSGDVIKIPVKPSTLGRGISLLHRLSWSYPKPMKVISLINHLDWEKEEIQQVVKLVGDQRFFNNVFVNLQIHKQFGLQ